MPWLTARENVAIGADRVYPQGHAAPSARRSSNTTSRRSASATRMDRLAADMSNGMRQRVGIARAFALSPKLLLLDEPFGMLDSLTRWELQEVLMEVWSQTRVTAICVTHDVDEAILLSDRVVMMTNGPEATIGRVVDVDLPRPRTRKALVEHPDYYRYRAVRPLVPRGIRARRPPQEGRRLMAAVARARRRLRLHPRDRSLDPRPLRRRRCSAPTASTGRSSPSRPRSDGLRLRPRRGPARPRLEGSAARSCSTDLSDPAFLRAGPADEAGLAAAAAIPVFSRRDAARASSCSSAAATDVPRRRPRDLARRRGERDDARRRLLRRRDRLPRGLGTHRASSAARACPAASGAPARRC